MILQTFERASRVKNFDDFDRIIKKMTDNPTKRLNLMLRCGKTRNQFEDFIKKQEPGTIFSNWPGIQGHVRSCERNGWVFTYDIAVFRKLSDPKGLFQIKEFKS